MIYKVLAPSQVVIVGFLNHEHTGRIQGSMASAKFNGEPK